MIIDIGLGEPIDVAVAGTLRLFFHIRRREVGEDGGLTLELCTPCDTADGGEQELLRFDLFRDDPHYHVPASDPKPVAIPVRGSLEALDFATGLLAREFDALLERAGHADLAALARTLDIGPALTALGEAGRRAPEPTRFEKFEVTPQMLGRE